ncbi:MAG: hypothetical protein FWC27_11055 [Firmicutes bacterium]|nr:hypothetical protein [Bacillota bacterium]
MFLQYSHDGLFEWQFYAETSENIAIYYSQGRFAPKYIHRVPLRRAKRKGMCQQGVDAPAAVHVDFDGVLFE